jgi:tRNA modification GTPase
VTFVDTAGLRASADPIEQAGMARTRSRLAGADLTLWLMAPDSAGPPLPESGARILTVATKADLTSPEIALRNGADIAVSGLTGWGLSALLERIEREAEAALGQGDAVITRERHRIALTRAVEAIERAEQALHDGRTELAAEDVRLALRAVGEITGRVDVEQVLDKLFATFCIGK